MSGILTYGGRTDRARTVLIYGNCQAPFMARMLSALDDLNDDYRFVYAPNMIMPGDDSALEVADVHLRDVALVLWQFEDRGNNPAALALRARLPASCPVVTFPSFVVNCLWPFACPEPRGGPEPAYPWKRYPIGDMIGLQIAQSGVAGPLAVAAYLDLSLRKMPNLQVRLERDLERMHFYDAQCDVKVADYAQDNFRDQHLFWTNGHLSEIGVTELARRVANVARPFLGGTEERMETCLAAARKFAVMGNVQLPIHPVVAETLGLRFWQHDMLYQWGPERWTFYEYIERYIAYDANW